MKKRESELDALPYLLKRIQQNQTLTGEPRQPDHSRWPAWSAAIGAAVLGGLIFFARRSLGLG